MSNYRNEYLKKRIKLFTPDKQEEGGDYFDVAKPYGEPTKKFLTIKDLMREKDLDIIQDTNNTTAHNMIGHSQNKHLAKKKQREEGSHNND